MPIYDYRCGSAGCGLRFERLTGRDATTHACPECGEQAAKVPSRPALHGRADPGLAREQMPQTWRGTYHGNREYVTEMRRQWGEREKLEAKYPELAGDTRPVAAHEGRYENAPLRVGDPVLPTAPPPPSAGHSHGHSHGQGHGHGHGH